MIKKIKKLSIIAILFIAIFMLKGTNVFATTVEEYFENFKNLPNEKTYNLYIGEEMNFVDSNTYYNLFYNSANIQFNSSNEKVAQVIENTHMLKAKGVGRAQCTVTITYNSETVSKTLNIEVKKTSTNTKLESKENDVKDIAVFSENKAEVLLANGELWSLDKNSFKFSKKISGNVDNYVYSNVYYEETDDKNDNTKLIQKLKKNNKLYAKVGKTEKKIEDVKQINKYGFLKENGNFYLYTYRKGKFEYKRKATKVDSLIGECLYIKDGKTYAMYGKKIFDFEIKQTSAYSSSCGSGLVLNKKGELWSYYYDSNKKSYQPKKIATKVKEIIGGVYYKTTDGKVKYAYGEYDNVTVFYKGISLSMVNDEMYSNYLALKDDHKIYLNGIEILNNVANIYALSDGYGFSNKGLIVRTDGSVWKLELAGKASLTKVRSGKESAKKISKPTNLKASKSGSKNIKVSWSKVDGASKYTVYRATSKNGSYKKIGTTTSGSYTDKKATLGKTYYYKVVANHSNSDYSSSKTSAIKMKIPKAPTNLKLSKKSKTSMKVAYKKSSGVTGYEIKYSTSKKFKDSKTKEVKGTSATIKSLKKKKTYYVKVRAYQTINGKKIYSSYSSTKYIKLK